MDSVRKLSAITTRAFPRRILNVQIISLLSHVVIQEVVRSVIAVTVTVTVVTAMVIGLVVVVVLVIRVVATVAIFTIEGHG